MLTLQNISYQHPDREQLFHNIHIFIKSGEKIALTGRNGSGKSTLLRIMAGELLPSEGEIVVKPKPYYVPQLFGQYDHLSIAEALGVEKKLQALAAIIDGNTDENHFTTLNDDWTIEERCQLAMQRWKLENLPLSRKLESLSGGQKTKIFLAGIAIHQPELILLDEPSNHLDFSARSILYDFIQSFTGSMVVVSHDRNLLEIMEKIAVLEREAITIYGGNYSFYQEQKELEKQALQQQIAHAGKQLRKAKEKERETMERQQKLDARGKRKQEKSGVARIMMNTLRNNAENSTSKLKDTHAEKISGIASELSELRSSAPDIGNIRFGFNHSALHKGKILFKCSNMNHRYAEDFLWPQNLHIEITSGERIALKGTNGSGKTTLIGIILNNIVPERGEIYHAEQTFVYIDQDYGLLDNSLTVYQQAQQYNASGFQEHEIKNRLNRFLFAEAFWNKSCNALSGGERMRLTLCCITLAAESPDIIVLDEPTNNLDIENLEILTAAVNEYRGTLIVISHDQSFLDAIGIGRVLEISGPFRDRPL